MRRIERVKAERGYEYDAFLDDQYIGTYPTRDAAHVELDRQAYENLTHQQCGEVSDTPGHVETTTMTTVYYTADELEAAYTQALQHDMPRAWRNALNKAYDLLLASDAVRVVFGPMGGITLAHIPSQHDDNVTYTVNGHCSCEAGARGKPCAHRAAWRLLNIASEQAAARQRQPAASGHQGTPAARGVPA